MKKSIVLFLCLMCMCEVYLACKQNHHKETMMKYKYMGEETISNVNYERDTIYAESADPFGVYNKKEGVVPSPQVAVEIAEIVLFHIYGKDQIECQQPYNVSLVNKNMWNISGRLKKGYEGGCFHITIDKRDGRILQISHGK